jgi:hypothetical protein
MNQLVAAMPLSPVVSMKLSAMGVAGLQMLVFVPT